MAVDNKRRKTTGLTLSEELQTTWSALDSEYAGYRSQHQDLTTYLLPNSGRFYEQDNTGQKRTSKIYDNTASRALRTLGAGLMAGATSPARPWMSLAAVDRELGMMTEVERWLEQASQRILSVCSQSNVYRALHQCYEDLGGFGTAAFIIVEDEKTVVHCHYLTCGEYRLAVNWKGEVDTCYRRFQRTVGQVIEEFGREKVTTEVREAYDNGEIHRKITLLHVIEPRRLRDWGKTDNLNMPWKSVYLIVGAESDHVLRESGFKRFPVLAPRWSVSGADVYGYGPGMEAYGDIRTLNHRQYRLAWAIDQQVDPSLQVPTGLKDRDVNRFPGGVTHLDSPAQTAGVRRLFEVNIELAPLLEDIRDIRQRINSSFFADLFLMLANTDTSKMTAREVAERHEEKMIQLGPVLERMHTELLQPLVMFIFTRLLDIGEIPPPPQELAGEEIRIELLGLLAQAQRAVELTSMERAFQVAGEVGNAKPEILDNIDADAVWNQITDMLGVPATVTLPARQRDELRKARAAAQNAQAQASLAEQQAKTAQTLSSTPTTGDTALSDVISLFSGYDQPAPQAVGA